jgi:hypothetical protein
MSIESTNETSKASELRDQFAEAAKARSTLRGNIEKRRETENSLQEFVDLIQLEPTYWKRIGREYSTLQEAYEQWIKLHV